VRGGYVTEAQNATDDAVMLSVRRGQRGLFAELFRRHRLPIFNYLVRVTGDHHAAEELTQETFLAALRACEGYRAEGKFRPWLYCIATNLARNEMTRGAREKARRGREDVDQQAVQDDRSDPTDELADREREEAVRSALTRLTLEERSVLVLRHYQGMRFADVARTLEVPEATVKSRMRYALAKLRRYLEPQMGKM
jgi:RNA polymerase sigma-70 factor, ECF subfamily